MHKTVSQNEIDWPVSIFLVTNSIVSLLLTAVYLFFAGWNWSIWITLLILSFITNLSVTAGYHRLYAHRSYEASTWVKMLYLLFATSAWQGSAYQWATGHRTHHKEVDSDDDPYSIKKGFWFAHMKWMLLKGKPETSGAPDLEKEPLLMFQHKYYAVLGIFCGYLLPAILGYALGDFWGGLIVLGALRITLTQQSTYLVNSLAHTWGQRPYTLENSARDNFVVALLTHGEGYHNFHHKFQIDYRNGFRWYHWDPTKWLIQMLSWFGAARKLRRVSPADILKARLQMQALQMQARGFSAEHLDALKARILRAQDQIKKLKLEYHSVQQSRKDAIRGFLLKVDEMKDARAQAWGDFKHKLDVQKIELQSRWQTQQLELQMRIAVEKVEFEKALAQWKVFCRSPIPLSL